VIFSHVLYQLSYLPAQRGGKVNEERRGCQPPATLGSARRVSRAAADAGSVRFATGVLDYLNDLVVGFFIRDPRARRIRTLRRKLMRYLRNSSTSIYTGSDARHVDANGEVRPDVRKRVLDVARDAESPELEWDRLCADFLTRAERELPGIVVQLPPDEPRMAYAGDKPL
jgi:hypothetical protein